MTSRTTADLVLEIYATDDDLSPYIALAHAVVQGNIKAFERCGLSEDELTQLETWLAAHFAATAPSSGLQAGNIQSEKEGQLSRSYGGQYGYRLESSRYGQAAQMLDRCGVLAQIGRRGASWEVA